MGTKKRLSDWTLEELSKYCKSMVGHDADCPKCATCEARGICERTPNKWKFDTLTNGEKAIMRACGAKWVTKDYSNAISIALWDEKPIYSEGHYDGGYCIGTLDAHLFPSVSGGECVELEE